MADDTFDLIIIGGGPGGYVAAIRAAQLGLRTAVAERRHLGGICLNWGCIPTKALLRSAELRDQFAAGDRFGLVTGDIGFDTAGVVEHSRRAAAQLSRGVDGLLKKNKVTVLWGSAELTSPRTVRVSQTDVPPPRGAKGPGEYDAAHIIIATGARPRNLPGLEADGDRVWSYLDAMVPTEIPRSLAVVGSGAIGAEFASFYRSMGSDVTLIEALPQVLPAEDEEIAGIVHKRFAKRGIKIRAGAMVTDASRNVDGVVLELTLGDIHERVEADRVISAIGVTGNIDGFGLEALGVATADGTIGVDGNGRTNVPGIYAIGDVAGPPMLAHKAQHEGVVCVEAIAGKAMGSVDPGMVPSCTYCDPQIASVGLTEAAAREKGIEVRVGRFPMIGNGKAVVLGETNGLVKTVFDANTERLLGAHLVGAEVTELIQGFVIALNMGATRNDLIHSIFPHPTLSEAMHESVLDATGRALHI